MFLPLLLISKFFGALESHLILSLFFPHCEIDVSYQNVIRKI